MNGFFALFCVVLCLLWIIPSAWLSKDERKRSNMSLGMAVFAYIFGSFLISGLLYVIPYILKLLLWRTGGSEF